MKTETTKEQLRLDINSRIPASGVSLSGKIAEILRRSKFYKDSVRVYCGPSRLLKQIRINILLDGKELILPAPGMKEGFYVLEPYSIPFKYLSMAVTYKGLFRYGKRLDNIDLKKLGVELLVDHVQAVDLSGYFLGDGKGFFDLALAVLADTGALAGGFHTVSAVDDLELIYEALPHDAWDCQSHSILSPEGIDNVTERVGKPFIIWDQLDMDRIKRVTPLWKHYVATREKKREG